MTIQQTTPAFAAEWQAWEEARWAAVSGPHGTASLADTVWLFAQEQRVAGVAGSWSAEGAAVRGEGLRDSGLRDAHGELVGDTVVLQAGDTLTDGPRLLRAFVRDGSPALRILDPDAETRTSLTGLDAYQPDQAWVRPAVFEPNEGSLEVELVDGHRSVNERSGTLRFELDGVERTLTATVGAQALSVVFADATSGAETYRFRFLTVPLPDAAGATVVDFTRAFLPPCAFSPHYVCPLPPPGNRFEFAVTAGEKLPVRVEEEAAA